MGLVRALLIAHLALWPFSPPLRRKKKIPRRTKFPEWSLLALNAMWPTTPLLLLYWNEGATTHRARYSRDLALDSPGHSDNQSISVGETRRHDHVQLIQSDRA